MEKKKAKLIDSSIICKSGQATIPEEVREILGLKKGDKVHFLKTPDGQIIIIKDVEIDYS